MIKHQPDTVRVTNDVSLINSGMMVLVCLTSASVGLPTVESWPQTLGSAVL